MAESLIEPGSFVTWGPGKENLFRMFHHNTAFRLYPRVPITGMLKRKDGKAGLMVCITPSGKREEIPVLLSECIPAVIPHAE